MGGLIAGFALAASIRLAGTVLGAGSRSGTALLTRAMGCICIGFWTGRSWSGLCRGQPPRLGVA